MSRPIHFVSDQRLEPAALDHYLPLRVSMTGGVWQMGRPVINVFGLAPLVFRS
jgi:hypothetical protein